MLLRKGQESCIIRSAALCRGIKQSEKNVYTIDLFSDQSALDLTVHYIKILPIYLSDWITEKIINLNLVS